MALTAQLVAQRLRAPCLVVYLLLGPPDVDVLADDGADLPVEEAVEQGREEALGGQDTQYAVTSKETIIIRAGFWYRRLTSTL